MSNQTWSAKSVKMQADKQMERNQQIYARMNELHKQTSTLTDMKDLTKINIECIQNVANLISENTETAKQIAQMTAENQNSSKRYFWASFVVSIVALIIAFCK